MEVTDIDLADPGNFVEAVPHEWFAQLRREAPVQWHPDPDGFAQGFWSVTRYDDCVGVNRDYEHFSSYRAATLFHDFDEEVLGQQRMMMLNMDPPMHTRYRRLVNKGFTPRMIRDLEAKVVASTDAIIDTVCEQGSADFVEQISAELPLQVIAELMGVPQSDRHHVRVDIAALELLQKYGCGPFQAVGRVCVGEEHTFSNDHHVAFQIRVIRHLQFSSVRCIRL